MPFKVFFGNQPPTGTPPVVVSSKRLFKPGLFAPALFKTGLFRGLGKAAATTQGTGEGKRSYRRGVADLGGVRRPRLVLFARATPTAEAEVNEPETTPALVGQARATQEAAAGGASLAWVAAASPEAAGGGSASPVHYARVEWWDAWQARLAMQVMIEDGILASGHDDLITLAGALLPEVPGLTDLVEV